VVHQSIEKENSAKEEIPCLEKLSLIVLGGLLCIMNISKKLRIIINKNENITLKY